MIGAPPSSPEEKASLAALYCALMVSEQLDAITSKDDIIVDGPFSQNPALLAVLAQLRPRAEGQASALRDGTTAGAAALALIDSGKLPNIALKLSEALRRRSPGSLITKPGGGRSPMPSRADGGTTTAGAQSWRSGFRRNDGVL